MTDTVGAELAATVGVTDFLAVEARTGRGDRFADIESVVTMVSAAAFAGKPPVTVTGDKLSPIALAHVPAGAGETVTAKFDLQVQEANGAWWLPESTVLKPGTVNVPAYYLTSPKWAMNLVATEAGRVAIATCPPALACWALLVPFADAITAPLSLRGPESGTLAPSAHDAAWAAVDEMYAQLGLDTEAVNGAVDMLRPGNGWSRSTADAQRSARIALVTALASAVTRETVARWRAVQLRSLLDRYYAKANKGQPTAHAVLTKALQPVVAAWFAGSWIAVLDYLDEHPASGEQITTALPEPRLYVQGSAKVEQVAAEKNLLVDDVARMLASYLGSEEIRSPVERRVELLRGYWRAVDDAHARQAPGMRPLLGLVGDRWLDHGDKLPFLAPSAEQLLPAKMLVDIDRLWGGECVPRYPERIVSSLFPHAQMASAFGVALSFWHNVGLTSWFLCHGPRARTTLREMPDFYGRDVTALAELGAPVNPDLFIELKATERRLGRPKDIINNRTVYEVATGITFETSMSAGTRRDRFEILRDIVTRHRRSWAETHLNDVLRATWEGELRELARDVNRTVAARGTVPTVKQFAKLGAPVANNWFGGDLSALYVALGEKPPVSQQRVRLLPYDRAAFCNQLFDVLGGRYVSNNEAAIGDAYNESWALQRVVQEAPRYVQLEELLDRSPTAQEFHAERYNWPDHVDFDKFAAAATEVRQTLPTEPASQPAVPAAAAPAATVSGAAPLAATHVPGPLALPAAPASRPDRDGLLRRMFGRKR